MHWDGGYTKIKVGADKNRVLVDFTDTKGGNIGWTSVKDNNIKE